MKKQKWGKWLMAELTTPEGMPIRIMISVPYDWNARHNNKHVAKYWAKRKAEAARLLGEINEKEV